MSDINTLMESLSKFNGKWPYQDAAEQLIKQQAEITTLREQVEKLTKERDELHRAFNQPVPRSEWEKMQEQLAALAEQNEKMREALAECEQALDECRDYPVTLDLVLDALSLPNLASPVLNRIKADGMWEAAKFCINNPTSDAHCLAEMLRAKADELEQSK